MLTAVIITIIIINIIMSAHASVILLSFKLLSSHCAHAHVCVYRNHILLDFGKTQYRYSLKCISTVNILLTLHLEYSVKHTAFYVVEYFHKPHIVAAVDFLFIPPYTRRGFLTENRQDRSVLFICPKF